MGKFLQLISLFVLSFQFSSANAKTINLRWVIAHQPISVFERAAKNFSEEVEQKSNGEIKVEVLTTQQYIDKYDNNKREKDFYNGKELTEELAKGSFEMSQTYSSILGYVDNRFWALDLPYLFKSHEHAAKVLDGKIGQRLMAGLEKKDIRGLAFTYSGGYRVIPSSGKEIHKAEDFKNFKINTHWTPVAQSIFETLGAQRVKGPFEENDQLAQSGKIDGYESTYVRYTQNHQKVAPVLNDTGHSLFLTSIVMNKSFFNSLSKEHQKIIETAAHNSALMEREDSINDAKKLKAEAPKKGIKIVNMSETEKTRMKKMLQPVYAKFEPVVGKQLIKEIQSIQ